jgi:hypothetical protein
MARYNRSVLIIKFIGFPLSYLITVSARDSRIGKANHRGLHPELQTTIEIKRYNFALYFYTSFSAYRRIYLAAQTA